MARIAGIGSDDADLLTREALAAAARKGYQPIAVAVVDVTGEVVGLRRADGAMPLTARVCVAKARTALLGLRPSRGFESLPGPIADSIQTLWQGDFVPRAGGLVLERDGVVLGAIGASGALAGEDEDSVQCAIDAWERAGRGDQAP